ncbi:MAG: response regulator [Anaerolineales bacterium]|nr:response regulator [Anaerolineales bacterium]
MSATQPGPILIVEDITAVREMIELQLRARGYDTVSARDGYEALEMIARQRPAAIVSDILMPRMDGFSLAHRLRSNPETATIPLIFLSATYVSAEDERFALNLGAIRFLPKPVDLEELTNALNEALRMPVPQVSGLSEREFYLGYRQRLKVKLQQKAQQIARTQQQMAAVEPAQRETYRHALAEAQAQYEEIQRELEALAKVLPNLE